MPKLSANLAPSVLNPRLCSARVVQTVFTAISFAGALLFSGCGAGRTLPQVSTSSAAAKVNGTVHGGQQPVSGALIQLWAAGSGGNGSAAAPLLTSAVFTDGGGGFSISGDYTCPTATTQVYITATGGNPGLSGTVNNSSLALVTALGDCGVLPTLSTLSINELTTVAAAYGLAPFASGVTQVGATATNAAGLRSAMMTAMMLADPYTGAAPAAALPGNATTETPKLISLANVIADCVNSDGSQQCTSLANDSSIPGLPTPTDTFQIALTVAQNPGSNVAAVFNHAPAQSAFGGGLTNSPNDWTMSMSYTGGGLGRPNGVSVDAGGSVWVSNHTGGVSGFSAQGVPSSGTAVTAGMGLSNSATVGSNGNVWVTNGAYDLNHADGSIALITPGGTVLSGGAGYTSGGLNLPDSIAAMSDGSVAVVSAGDSLLTLLGADGTVLSGPNGYGAGLLSQPSALVVDGSSNVWIANRGSGSLVELDHSGNLLLQSACCSTPDSLAIDSNGNLWVGDSSAGTISEVRNDGTVLNVLGGGSNGTSLDAMTIDGGGHLFILDAVSGAVIEVHDSSYAAPGSPVGSTPGLALDAHLNSPAGLAADASGSLWVTSSADNRLVRFVGMATPVSTPHISLPVQP